MQLSSIAEYIFNTEFSWSEEYTDSQYGSLAEERQREVILMTDWLDTHIGELNILINTDFQVEYILGYQNKNDPQVVISSAAWSELPDTGGDDEDSKDKYDPFYQPFVEGMKKEESSILIEMYMANYYRKMVRNAMRTLDGSSLASESSFAFKSIREGDSVIEGHPIKEKQSVVAEYKGLELESRKNVKSLAHSYNMFQSKPGQVFGDDAS